MIRKRAPGGGRKPGPPHLRRIHRVEVALNDGELAALDALAIDGERRSATLRRLSRLIEKDP